MSARCSNSPELHLIVAESPLRRRLLTALALLVLVALCSLARSGYATGALLLAPPVAFALWRLGRDSGRGTGLRWRKGRWSIEHGDECRPIELKPGWVRLPPVVFLQWREVGSGRPGRLWLFADSVPERDLRRLRSRLSLGQGRVVGDQNRVPRLG